MCLILYIRVFQKKDGAKGIFRGGDPQVECSAFTSHASCISFVVVFDIVSRHI